MKYPKIDFVKLLKRYHSGWVAISADFQNVVFWGKTLRDTMEKAKNYKAKLYYFPVEKTYAPFVGNCLL